MQVWQMRRNSNIVIALSFFYSFSLYAKDCHPSMGEVQSRCFQSRWKTADMCVSGLRFSFPPRYMPLRQGFSGDLFLSAGGCMGRQAEDGVFCPRLWFVYELQQRGATQKAKLENGGSRKRGNTCQVPPPFLFQSVTLPRGQPWESEIRVLPPEDVRYASSGCSDELRCNNLYHLQEEQSADIHHEEL